MRSTCLWLAIVIETFAAAASAQQRPLQTQDPEPIGTGNVLVEAGISYARDEFLPLSGLTGNLWQLPVIGIDIGISPIAELQISGGPYNRLTITGRRPAPLASDVTAMGASTHAVDDLAIGAKIRLVAESATRPAIGFRFSVRLPNAKHGSGLGQDTTDFSASALAGKTIASLRVAATVGLTIMSEPLDSTRQNDVLTYGFSLVRPIRHGATFVGDVNGRWSTRSGTPPIGTESRGMVTVGGRYTRGAARFDAAAVAGLTSIDPTIGVTLGWTYVFKAFSLP